MNPLRIAVIGAGHLGRIHTRLLLERQDCQLVTVVEPDAAVAARISEEFHCETTAGIDGLGARIDAAVVAAPTHAHYQIADRLLRQGIHVLMEKPMTTTAPQADHLVRLATAHQVVLQVGHVERFNPAFETARSLMPRARYLEASRMSGYTFRSIDVGVVHDLMIHDIDLVCSLVNSRLVDCQAIGIAVFGPHEDMAQARLQFENGAVANLSASRCSFERERRISWMSEDGYMAVDLDAGTVQSITPSQIVPNTVHRDVTGLTDETQQEIRNRLFESVLPMQTHQVQPANAIQEEHSEFIAAIAASAAPRVDGAAGRQAVAIAQSILESIANHQWQTESGWRQGHQGLEPQLFRALPMAPPSPNRQIQQTEKAA